MASSTLMHHCYIPITPFWEILTNPNHSWCYWTQHDWLELTCKVSPRYPNKLPQSAPSQPWQSLNPCQQFIVTLCALTVILDNPNKPWTEYWSAPINCRLGTWASIPALVLGTSKPHSVPWASIPTIALWASTNTQGTSSCPPCPS